MCIQNTTDKNKADSQGAQRLKSVNTLKKGHVAMLLKYLIFPM